MNRTLWIVIVMVLASCGGDDDASTPEESAAATASAPSGTTDSSETVDTDAPTSESGNDPATSLAESVETVDTTTSVTSPPASSDAACPTDAEMSEAAGESVALDEPSSTPGFFCPYASTDTEPPEINFSVTRTPMNVTSEVDAEQQEVPGLGELALWSEGAGELLVWIGESSIIVSVQVFDAATSFDDLGLATRIAQAVLGSS